MNDLDSTGARHIDFAYFMEGKGSAWTRFFEQALREDVGLGAIQGKRILDIGTRDGRVASCFALLGAQHVTGIDTRDIDLSAARAEAHKHGVQERVDFHHYDDNLDAFANGEFDLIFTKSVLVVVPKLTSFLTQVADKLTQDGAAVFLENAKGGRVVEFLRGMRHRKWGYSRATMLTDVQVQAVRDEFEIVALSRSSWPPVFKIVTRKRSR